MKKITKVIQADVPADFSDELTRLAAVFGYSKRGMIVRACRKGAEYYQALANKKTNGE